MHATKIMNTSEAKAAIYGGRAVRSGDASPSAQAWLRREAGAGRIARLTGLPGWCPAHCRWTFYVSSNRAPGFEASCRDAFNGMIRAAIMDAYNFDRAGDVPRLQALIFS